ncbi:MAG: class I SAM-dependent methyltransferase [Caldilineaceae bacterium]
MIDYSFQRYLSAKRTVDDRALNAHVWQGLRNTLRTVPSVPLQVLEIGAGIGTMIDRALEWRLFDETIHSQVVYTALDEQEDNVIVAQQKFHTRPDWLSLRLEHADLFAFAERPEEANRYDLLIAHAFLDLMDIPQTLPLLKTLLSPGGLVYFTINFDGATILQPEIHRDFDQQIETLYHRTMDERITGGQLSGDSQSGRHLFGHLREAGIEVLAAGSSDWVVFGNRSGYPADEAYFLHYIIHTMQGALHQHPQLDQARFETWIKQRHQQVEAGDLVYIAHQIDFLGTL